MDLTNIGFMKIRRQTTVLSVILIVISIYSLFVNKLNFGLDFTGGSLIEIRLTEDIDSLEEIRGVIQSMNLNDFQVNYFGSNRDISIKVPGGDNSIDESAYLLGYSKFKTFSEIHIPHLKTNIILIIVLISLEIIKELPITMILRPFNFETFATQAYVYASQDLLEAAALPSLLLIIWSTVFIIFSSKYILSKKS